MASAELQQLEDRFTKLVSRHGAEQQALRDQIQAYRQQQMDNIKEQARALGYTVTVRTGTAGKAKKSGSRKPATCKTCTEASLPGTGHTARTHDKWLATQDAKTQGKF